MESEDSYRVYNSQPLIRIQIQMNPLHTFVSYLSFIILSPYLSLGFSNGLISTSFLAKISFVFIVSQMHFTCSIHLILLDLIILITENNLIKGTFMSKKD
jgi:hypothetical protein